MSSDPSTKEEIVDETTCERIMGTTGNGKNCWTDHETGKITPTNPIEDPYSSTATSTTPTTVPVTTSNTLVSNLQKELPTIESSANSNIIQSTMLTVAEPSFTQLEEDYLLEAWRSTYVSGAAGFHIKRLETEFSSKIAGCKYGVACANGTVAIHLAWKALNLQPGDEVLLPDWGYVASAAATVTAGGIPVLVDCDKTGRMDPEAIRAAIIPGQTKYLMVVHLYGHPCDMVSIMKIANEFQLIVLEDCAEAHGALCNGKLCGSFGHASTYSFFANKVMTTGEGGIVCTNDSDLATRLNFLCTHAMSTDVRYSQTEIGFNYRLSNLLAAVGCAQLERFDDLILKRKKIIEMYQEALNGFCGIRINPRFDDNVTLCPWLASLYLSDSMSFCRDEICKILKNDFKVDTRPFFYPMSIMPPYKRYETVTKDGRGKPTTGANRMATLGFVIPTIPDMPVSDVQYVVNAIKDILTRVESGDIQSKSY
jgi:perosamine synthetase